MVTPDAQTIKLEVTVDKAEIERLLGQAFNGAAGSSVGGGGGAAGGGGGGGGARGGRRGAPQRVEPGQQMNKSLRHLTKLVGIGFAMNAMVKNSQVMSTSLGALSSTFGAIFDSFLAPIAANLLPKLLTVLGKLIVPAGEAGKDVVNAGKDMKDSWTEFKNLSKTEKAKQGGSAGLNILMDLIRGGSPIGLPGGTTAQRSARETAAARKSAGLGEMSFLERNLLGPSRSTKKETNEAIVGGNNQLGAYTSFNTMEAMLRMSTSQLAAFMLRQKQTVPSLNIQVTGGTPEEIAEAIKAEVKTVLEDNERNRQSAGFGNN